MLMDISLMINGGFNIKISKLNSQNFPPIYIYYICVCVCVCMCMCVLYAIYETNTAIVQNHTIQNFGRRYSLNLV